MWWLAWACTASPPPVAGPPPVDLRLFVEGVVATRDLGAGQVLVAGDLRLGAVPSFSPSPVTDPAPLVGSTVREPILAGEPVRTERIVAGEGYAALVEEGVPLALSVPRFAVRGIGPGCRVEVVALGDPSRRPKLAVPGALRVLGIEPGDDERALLIVEAPSSAVAGDVTIVALQLRDVENPSEPVFHPPDRPGRPIAVAVHPLLPGAFVRSEDLGEVGGIGIEALGLPDVWARTPHARILPGEIVRPERLDGLCVRIPDGMRGVVVPAGPGTVRADQVDTLVSFRVQGHELRDVYVLSVADDTLTVAGSPDLARAIAVVAATAGEPFELTDR